MKKILLLTGLFVFIIQIDSIAQASFGTTANDDNLMLWVESLDGDGGLVIPRFTTDDRNTALEDDNPDNTPVHACQTADPLLPNYCEPGNTSILPIGTTIFNVTTQNLEWWNGIRWTKSINAGFESGSALPEIFLEDNNDGLGTQFIYEWSSSGVFGAGELLVWQMEGLEDANGYSIDRRSPDLVTAGLFEWDETGQKFIPDTDNGTVDLVFEFDLINNTGTEGTTIQVDAWDATVLTSFTAAGVPTFAGSGTATPSASDVPVATTYQIIPKGNNDTYNNYPQVVKLPLTPALFTNGVRFTITVDTETITVTDFAIIITRVR